MVDVPTSRALHQEVKQRQHNNDEDQRHLTIAKRVALTIYNDVYDEHLFVFAAGLSYYLVLSLFPLLILIASVLRHVPVPHLFDALLRLMALLVPGDGMSLVRSILSDVIGNKHP